MRQGKTRLNDVLANHLRADFNAVEDLAIVDGNDGADQLGDDWVRLVLANARMVEQRVALTDHVSEVSSALGGLENLESALV